MTDESPVNEVREKLDELAGALSWLCSRSSGDVHVCRRSDCSLFTHGAVDEDELTLDLGKKKKKKKKDAADAGVRLSADTPLLACFWWHCMVFQGSSPCLESRHQQQP